MLSVTDCDKHGRDLDVRRVSLTYHLNECYLCFGFCTSGCDWIIIGTPTYNVHDHGQVCCEGCLYKNWHKASEWTLLA